MTYNLGPAKFDKFYLNPNQEFLDHFDSAINELKRNNVDLSVITIFTPDPIKLREQLKSHPKVKCRGRWLYYEDAYVKLVNPCINVGLPLNRATHLQTEVENRVMSDELVRLLTQKGEFKK